VVYDGVVALDLVGPIEAFTIAGDLAPGRPRPYQTLVIGPSARPFRAESGVLMTPDRSFAQAPRLDTVIVPGGRGLREPRTQSRVTRWLARTAPRTRRVATVCTGIYGLAPTGLLDGRRVTTHWRFAQRVAREFPALQLERDSIFIKDGAFYTSAGVTAGIDLALALIEEDLGAQVALAVAREMVVYLKRAGGQEQFSEPLAFQTRAADRFAELAAWIAGHLRHDLSVETLAERVHLSPRQFHRRFTQSIGKSPAVLVEELRLDEARRRLTRGVSVAAVADAVGFRSADSFRRAFERRYGVSPSAYAGRFSHLDPSPEAAPHASP